MKKLIRLDESDLVNIVKNTLKEMKMKLNEYASALLYRFIDVYEFFDIVDNNRFRLNQYEKKFSNGKNVLSFTRVKSFREGYATTKNFEWCAIRLTVDGDLINRKPNFKEYGKQKNMKVKPFDYWYKEMEGETNGKEMSRSKYENWNGKVTHATHLPFGKYKSDDLPYYLSILQSHTYDENEDRLYSDANNIPNAIDFILSVDILLKPYEFVPRNLNERTELYNIIKLERKYKDKIHLYKTIEELEKGVECDKNILLIKDNNKLETPYSMYDKEYDSMHYFTS